MEENILTEGRVREPLTIWKGHGVLVDGHHRKRVLDEHPEIPFTVDEIEFVDEDAVDEWIIKNQLGKHNLTIPQQTVLRGLLAIHAVESNATQTRDEHGRYRKSQNETDGGDALDKLSKETGVSRATYSRAKAVVKGIQAANKVDSSFQTDYMAGKIKATQKDISDLREAKTDEELNEKISEIRNPIVSKVTSRTSGSKDQRIFNERLNAISAEMEKPKNEYTLDDVLRDLNNAEDVFISQIEFILRARKSVLDADERTHEALIGYIESVINDLNEMKGRF